MKRPWDGKCGWASPAVSQGEFPVLWSGGFWKGAVAQKRDPNREREVRDENPPWTHLSPASQGGASQDTPTQQPLDQVGWSRWVFS